MADLLDFDFGFTAVDENELEAVQTSQVFATEASANVHELEDKLNNKE